MQRILGRLEALRAVRPIKKVEMFRLALCKPGLLVRHAQTSPPVAGHIVAQLTCKIQVTLHFPRSGRFVVSFLGYVRDCCSGSIVYQCILEAASTSQRALVLAAQFGP